MRDAAAPWVHEFLNATDVSIQDIVADSHSAGAHHSPGFFLGELGTTAFTDETRLEFVMQVQVETVANFSQMENVVLSHMNKHVPLPKMMVPVGKDAAGKPVALQFMGRAGPVGASDLAYAFDDELLRGLDVPFLRDVDTLVEAMVAADPSLARVAPELVTRDLAA